MTATFKVFMDVSLPCSVSFCIWIIIVYFCGEIKFSSSSSYSKKWEWRQLANIIKANILSGIVILGEEEEEKIRKN